MRSPATLSATPRLRLALVALALLAVLGSHSNTFAAGPTLIAQELEPFLDGVMSVAMAASDVPGGVVVIVKDGEVLLAKGYGYADVAAQRPVDPETTLFRIGSVTKLFVWTAVMQLVEAGKLDLNADINRYLDFEIPQTFPEPITLAHLMAHAAGFEEQVVGLFARSPEALRPLGELLPGDLPARVRPPGTLSAYSNHGVALAGYIVERVSGLPLEAYLEANLFAPLGMTHTTLRQPVPEALKPQLAYGYRYERGQYVANPFYFIPLYPAGAASASALDMARFMIAHLQQGAYGDARILEPDTAAAMHRTHFRHDARLPGWAHGFAEGLHGGVRTIGHSGGTTDFFTEFTLVPEHNLGLFASFNGANGFIAQQQLLEAFWARYFPTSPIPVAPAPDAAARAAQVAGFYSTTRACATTFCKAITIFPTLTVEADANGALVVQSPFFGTRRYLESEPWVFRQADGDDLLVVRRDAGRVTHLFTKDAVANAFVRQAWFEALPFTIALHLGALVVFLSALIGWPLLRGSNTRAAAWARGFATLTILAFVAALVTMGLSLGNANEVVFGIPPLLQAALTLARVAALLTIGLVVFAVVAWIKRYFSVWGRLHYTLVALAALATSWWLWYWKVLGL